MKKAFFDNGIDVAVCFIAMACMIKRTKFTRMTNNKTLVAVDASFAGQGVSAITTENPRYTRDLKHAIKIAKMGARTAGHNLNIIIRHPSIDGKFTDFSEYDILSDAKLKEEMLSYVLLHRTVDLGIPERTEAPTVYPPDFPAYQNLPVPIGCDKVNCKLQVPWQSGNHQYIVNFHFEIVAGSKNAYIKKFNSIERKLIALLQTAPEEAIRNFPGITLQPYIHGEEQT